MVLEIDAIYVDNKTDSIQFKAIQLPVLVRFNLLPGTSLGLGGYAQYALDSVPGWKKTNFGGVGSVRFELPLAFAKLFLEGRYLFGLSNLVEGVTETQQRSFQALFGLRF
jgi:hypothetical protein